MRFRLAIVSAIAFAVLHCAGCAQRKEPPGAEGSEAPTTREVTGALSSLAADPARSDGGSHEAALGTIDDNLPFAPTAKKIASIAWRTWIYTDTGAKRTRYGYLRAGGVLDVRESGTAKNEGCANGTWYRINPRGFVCTGKGATLDLAHSVVQSSSIRPVRKQGPPYLYAMANEIAPMLYFRLPTEQEMLTIEGDGIRRHVAAWRERTKLRGTLDLLGTPGAPPAFLIGIQKIEKPYGVPQLLHYAVHAGRSSNDAGFALTHVFEHEGRPFGLTTELDIIALDRTRLVKPSEFHGVELGEAERLPVAFVDQHVSQRFRMNALGQLQAEGSWPHREGLKLTGKTHGGEGGFWETVDGTWVAAATVRVLKVRTSLPSFGKAARKWIDISIQRQSLVAYEGDRPVYATLVSTGRGGLGDPEEVLATVRGTFMIHSKHVSATMDGEEDKADSFNLRDVPFVQYFHKGYALHGTYWHDEFGKMRSHGCVNLSPTDASWLFEWTDPVVPEGWHGALNMDRGTVVYIHP